MNIAGGKEVTFTGNYTASACIRESDHRATLEYRKLQKKVTSNTR